MSPRFRPLLLLLSWVFLAAPDGHAQQRPDPAALLAAQRAAMAPLARLDGTWRGTATTTTPAGSHAITQTERVGPMLDGAIRVIEGRGYEADGRTAFNAFAVISYAPADSSYTIRSWAQGFAGGYTFRPTAEGFTWEIPAGPGTTIRYTARVQDGTWHEVGDRIVAGQEPVRFFEMTLSRLGDSDWPAGGAVGVE